MWKVTRIMPFLGRILFHRVLWKFQLFLNEILSFPSSIQGLLCDFCRASRTVNGMLDALALAKQGADRKSMLAASIA